MPATISAIGFFDIATTAPKTVAVTRLPDGTLANAGGPLTSYPFVAGINSYMSDISGSGNAVVFASDATNLVQGDTNGRADIFYRNTATGAVQRINISTAGDEANGSSTENHFYSSSISDDGRYVLFGSAATNLVAGDTNANVDFFLRDTQLNTTQRVSTDGQGGQIAQGAFNAAISGNGRYVVMVSGSQITAVDTNIYLDVYRKDLVTGAVVLVSTLANGAANSGFFSREPRISADGNIIAFYSDDALIADGLGNGWFIKNMTTGVLSRPDVNAPGVKAGAGNVILSGDGNVVAFDSFDRSLVPNAPAGTGTVLYTKNLVTGAIAFQDTTPAGALPNGNERIGELSFDGRYLSFYSSAPLDPDTSFGGIFRKDTQTGAVKLVSRSDTGDALEGINNFTPAAMTADGSKLLFSTGTPLAQPGLPPIQPPIDRLYIADAATVDSFGSRGDGRFLGLNVTVNGATTVRASFGVTDFVFDGTVLPNGGTNTVQLGWDYFGDGLPHVTVSATDGATTAQQDFDVRIAFNAAAGAVFSSPVVFGGNLGNTLFGAGDMANYLRGGAGNDVLVGDGPLSLTPVAEQIRRLYIATLDRAPDGNGWRYWVDQRNNGVNLNEVAAGFVGSPEFQNTYGALNNQQFVTLLYNNVLDRAPDATGLAVWQGALDGGQLSRTQVVTAFSESPEFRAGTRAELHDGQVYRLYGATLARQPDSAGFTTWTDALGAGRSLANVAAGFVNSTEFQATYGTLNNTQFVTLLYNNVLGRAPDAGGLDYWVTQLSVGVQTRTQVVIGFSESTEYAQGTRAGVDNFMRGTMSFWSDLLVGGAGDDQLTGGRGPDRFVFTASEGGNDTIYGFDSFDTLELRGFGFGAPAQALASVTQQGSDAVLSYSSGRITFAETTVAQLQGLPAHGWIFG